MMNISFLKFITVLFLLFLAETTISQIHSYLYSTSETREEYFSLILNEDDLRTINEIVVNRMTEKENDATFTYLFEFSDETYTETSDFNSLFTEKNSQDRKITALEINAKGGQYVIEIKIGKFIFYDPKISYSVQSASNKDWVTLTKIDLDKYINKISDKESFVSKNARSVRIVLTLAILIISIVLYLTIFEKKLQEKKGIRTENNILLYFLLIIDYGFVSIFFISFYGLTIYLMLGSFFHNFLYPDLLFLIGNEIENYKKILDYREYFFSTIITGFLVSVVSSIVASSISKSHHKPTQSDIENK